MASDDEALEEYDWETESEDDDDLDDDEITLAALLQTLEGEIQSFPLADGSTALRLAECAYTLEHCLGSDFSELFKMFFLHQHYSSDLARAGFASETLASIGFGNTAPGMSGSVDLTVLIFPFGLRVYLGRNDWDGCRLLGGGVPNEAEGADQLAARGLEEVVRGRDLPPHIRDALLAVLECAGTAALENLEHRDVVSLWLEEVRPLRSRSE